MFGVKSERKKKEKDVAQEGQEENEQEMRNFSFLFLKKMTSSTDDSKDLVGGQINIRNHECMKKL